jgi:CarboxypepD_reg-like domain
MAYDIIGNVVDEDNKPLPGVLVTSSRTNGTTTDDNGYYAIKSTEKVLNFQFVGYKPQTYDLSKYPDGSAINVDIKMIPDTTLKGFNVEANSPLRKYKYIIGALTGVALASMTYGIAKKYTQNVPLLIIGSLTMGGLGYFGGYKAFDNTLKK